jgi:nucleoside-diphosphate-sugar epimerase
MSDTILVIGAGGQLGTELVENLRDIFGGGNVVASDVKEQKDVAAILHETGPYEKLDVLENPRLTELLTKYKPTQVYHLAALLSATAEKHPKFAWQLNMDGLFNVLDAAIDYKISKVYWPSSIAVFGPNTPRINTPQHCIMDPNTIYGISKQAGERYCEYYFAKYGVDVRSIRYPGLIGYKSAPGGGTTDYAVDIYHEALKTNSYECFLPDYATLPMLYMPDALKATINLMEAPADSITIRSSYNVAGMSFNPEEIAASIKKQMPNFILSYDVDPTRAAIAASWPESIDDSQANKDWNWKPDYDLDAMTKDMLDNLRLVAKV